MNTARVAAGSGAPLRDCVRCTGFETVRRGKALWSLPCPGCHCHQHETGPAHDQVSAWRAEVGEQAREVDP